MVNMRLRWLALVITMLIPAAIVFADQPGGIRGMVIDKEFDSPLPLAEVLIADTDVQAVTTEDGSYVFSRIEPGIYTLVFSKEGYSRQVVVNVVVSPEVMTEVNATLSGEFAEMDEFVVHDMQLSAGSEVALLELRTNSSALMDSIGSEMMSRAGASDAASALKLVSGATLQDGKYAVIRGLPDRYVNSQMNGVRLPTADANKRAVQLDQFPAAMIESVQVSKTFTPDQQGDASGGAVNVVLKSVPDENTLQLNGESSFNNQAAGNDKFLTYKGGGVTCFGHRDSGIPSPDDFDKTVGVSRGDAPTDYKWSLSGGGKRPFYDTKLGFYGSMFYKRSSSFYDNGIDDSYWVTEPGGKMTPQTVQGIPPDDFKTALYDVTRSTQEMQMGGLGIMGLETEKHKLNLLFMETHSAEDVTTLAEDTRGKAYYFPGYNPYDPHDAGNQKRQAAPYLRNETLSYTERDTQTLQLRGRHTLEDPDWNTGEKVTLSAPEIDWYTAYSTAEMNQPDKRQFGSLWWGPSYFAGYPPSVPEQTYPATYYPYKPAANFTLGNLQHLWKEISEQSHQYAINVKQPFKQWSDGEGYLKTGLFYDLVRRQYNQESFSNFNDNSAHYVGLWDDYWSAAFPSEDHPVTAANVDVDYKGRQDILAGYGMIDLPLCSFFNIIGGARVEYTKLRVINQPESDATWIPPDSSLITKLNPGDADVDFKQTDVLPVIGFVFKPHKTVTIKASYSETVARQTFKELTPIQQMEYLGGDVFVGNPELKMSSLKNYDLRLDWTPHEDTLVSGSYFFKKVKDPIEYVQKNAGYTYTTPENYPRGELSGFEFEVRQQLKRFWKELEGISVGANATVIDSEVTLPAEEAKELKDLKAPMSRRDMTNAPKNLYNLFMMYDLDRTGTQFGVFYTIRGDTLTAGDGQSNGNFIPAVYDKQYGTLNMSISQKLGKIWTLKFQCKNLTNPHIEQVYRSKYIDSDIIKTSYTKGSEFAISLSAIF
jgi:outer membrane receptor protein involved in Fe transport